MNLFNVGSIARPIEETPPATSGINVASAVPKGDVMDRRNLISSIDDIALECRESPSEATDGSYTVATLAALLFAILLGNSLFLKPVASLLGGIVPSHIALPIAVIVGLHCLGRIVYARLKGELEPEFGYVVAFLLCLPILGLLSRPFGSPARMAVTLVALGLVGWLSDKMMEHTAYFYTANLRLPYDDVKRRRSWWRQRFRGSRPDEPDRPAALSDYPWGFGILASFAVISQLEYRWLAVIVPPLLGLAWAYRRKNEMPAVSEFASKVLAPAIQSWICWGRWEGPYGSRTPGVFTSPAGGARERLLATSVTLWTAATAFVPPVSSWWRGSDGEICSLWQFLLHSSESFLLPLVMLLTAFIGIGGATAGAYYQAIEAADAPATKERRDWTDWRCYVVKFDESVNPQAKRHRFLGIHKEGRYPVFLHDSLLDVPLHILGPSGSGKTAGGFTPLTCYAIKRGDAVVVFDLKGDRNCFEAVREAAMEAERTFKYFTLELGKASYAFNPFLEANNESVSFSHVVETHLEALGLSHGIGYGKSFFTAMNRLTLLNGIKANPSITTYQELHEQIANDSSINRRERQDSLELIAKLSQLADIQALNWRRRLGMDLVADNAIYMPDVLAHNQVVYFNLPALSEPQNARTIACLGVNAVMNAAKQYTEKHGEPKRVVVGIDEFQRAQAPSFLLLEAQGRAFGLSLLLSNQNLSDLDSKDTPGLLESTVNNSAVHIYFSPAEPGLEDVLIKQSCESRYVCEPSITQSGEPDQQENPIFIIRTDTRLSRTDLKAYSSQPNIGLVQIRQNVGYSCFGGHLFAVEFGFHISREEYDTHRKTPWPVQSECTLLATRQVSASRPAHAIEESQLLDEPKPRTRDRTAAALKKHPSDVLSAKAVEWQERLRKAYEIRTARKERNHA